MCELNVISIMPLDIHKTLKKQNSFDKGEFFLQI